MKYKIAVVTGGYTAEKNISVLSAGTVVKHLNPELFEVYLIYLYPENWYYENESGTRFEIDKNDFSISLPGEKVSFDFVYMALHGSPAEDGKLQGYLDLLQIPYFGSGVFEMALTFDKAACKQMLTGKGIPMAKGISFHKTKSRTEILEAISTLQFPVFVKPNKNGSSYGVSKVAEMSLLSEVIEIAFEFDDEIIVEEFIKGRELTRGVFESKNGYTALPATEIISKNEFFDYKAKYLGESKEVTPAEISETEMMEVQALSIEICKTLNLKGLARVDYIFSGSDFYFLEVNTIPGMTDESLVPQQARAAGIPLQSFLSDIILTSISGYGLGK